MIRDRFLDSVNNSIDSIASFGSNQITYGKYSKDLSIVTGGEDHFFDGAGVTNQLKNRQKKSVPAAHARQTRRDTE